MRRLLTGYAVSFNRRYKRCGQLFQNRYKSIVCQKDAYLKELVRYIHLNPIRAKIVDDLTSLEKYPFCGHGMLAGYGNQPWQDDRYVLKLFGDDLYSARERYLSYVGAGLDQGRRPELVGGGLIRSFGGWGEVKKHRQQKMERIKGDQRILGDSGFVDSMFTRARQTYERGYQHSRISDAAMWIHLATLETMHRKSEPVVTFHLGLCHREPFDPDKGVRNLALLVDAARTRNITVCLENLRRGPASHPENIAAWAEVSVAAITLDIGHALSCKRVQSGELLVMDFTKLPPVPLGF